MTSPLTRRLALLLLAAGIGGYGVAASAPTAAATPLSVETFFKNPALGKPTLSPSGKKIAMVVPTKSGRLGLAVADVASPDKFVGIAQFPDADVQNVDWVTPGPEAKDRGRP